MPLIPFTLQVNKTAQKIHNIQRNTMGGAKVLTMSSIAVVILALATDGLVTPILPGICRLPCSIFSCAVTKASDCGAGEEYVINRRWCLCCAANCCGACVTEVGLGDNCTAQYDAGEGHYEVCPLGSVCDYDTNRCETSN